MDAVPGAKRRGRHERYGAKRSGRSSGAQGWMPFPERSGGGGMSLLYFTLRRLRVFIQQPAFLVFTLIQPVIWPFLFGNLFRRIVDLPGFGGGSYLTYLVPGVVVMTAVSSSMWSGMGVLEEIDRGTMDRF